MVWLTAFLLATLCLALAEVVRLRKANKALKRLLATDELTGVCTRRELLRLYAKPRASSSASNLQLVFIDMNSLKALNSEGGHVAGDMALRHLGQVLSGFCKPGEIAARYGGDEFVLFMNGSPAAVGARVDALNESLRECHRFTWAQQPLQMSGDLLAQINTLSVMVLARKHLAES